MNFEPMLAPNKQPDLDIIKYPILASYKLDGIRCIFHPELGMVSRSLKPIPNKQLQEKFAHILEYVKGKNIILDGELYAHELTFQEIQSVVMTQDFHDQKTLTKYIKTYGKYLGEIIRMIEKIQFHCFDFIFDVNQEQQFRDRDDCIPDTISSDIVRVDQFVMLTQKDILGLNEVALAKGYEGLILKDPNAPYKFGRGTLKEGIIYKVKPYIDFSAKIKGVVQATVVDPNAEKKINELGHSVTSKKKDDRVLIEKASAFVVDYNGQDLKISIAAPDTEKSDIWAERDLYIGKEVNFKGMLIGAKDLPRHPVTTRYWKHDE